MTATMSKKPGRKPRIEIDDLLDGVIPADAGEVAPDEEFEDRPAKRNRYAVCDARDWSRNKADGKAIANGCRFDVLRGAYTVWWIERYCNLYEGQTGRLILRGCHQCHKTPKEFPEWNDEAKAYYLKRAAKHIACIKAGHRIDWQFDVTMRTFGWVRYSSRLKRWIRRHTRASVFVPKKNKKSPTLSAWGMYLLVGDGEPGQHVFFAAKDGQQAREIAGQHAIKMLEQSPELSLECSINRTLCQITHDASSSNMRPLSSSNSTTQKSKEGLNGSTLVDEVHVVDRAYINRISRAGISRDEPLHAEFSTSGNDPDSYGKSQFDKAIKVADGDIDDERLMVAVYAVPQDLTLEALNADPLKYGYLANPAMGHTVDPDEFLSDYNASKNSAYDLAVFMMYRLNKWQHSASPWLKATDWNKGERDDLKLEDFEGQQCYASLDLASVRDFAAFCLTFPVGGEQYAQFWWYWLPQATAVEYGDKIPIADWLADSRCQLKLTDGARINFGGIRADVKEISKRFPMAELAYDDWNAEQPTQEICEGIRDNAGREIEQGIGIPRVNFSQSLQFMNEPTKRFEAAVIDGNILHNGDPLTKWMIGNATIKPDGNGNYKPMKPPLGDTRKIDGVIVALMGRARAELGGGGSIYDEPGSTAL